MSGETPSARASWGRRLTELEEELSKAGQQARDRLRQDWKRALPPVGRRPAAMASGSRATPPAARGAVRLGADDRSLLTSVREALGRVLVVLRGRTPEAPATTSTPQTMRDEYFDLGRLLARLRRDPTPAEDTLRRQVNLLHRRTTWKAEAELRREAERLRGLATEELPAAEGHLRQARDQRETLARQVDGARIWIRVLAASLCLAAALTLTLAEFALAERLTSFAMGLDNKPSMAWLPSSAHLFALALCALTLPFKWLADWMEEYCAESRRRRFLWLGALACSALVLVAAVGVMRGDTSYWLSSAVRVVAGGGEGEGAMPLAGAAGPGGGMPQANPSPAAGAPASPPSSTADESRPLHWLYVGLFVAAGVLFPLVGGVALSKARAPVADVIRGLGAWLGLCRATHVEAQMARHAEGVRADIDACVKSAAGLFARAGPHGGWDALVAVIASAIEGRDPSAAVALHRAADAWTRSAGGSTADVRAALASAAGVVLAAERRDGVQALIQLVSRALDAEGLVDVARDLADSAVATLRLGYACGIQTAPELLADATAADLYALELRRRAHADLFGSTPPVGGGPWGGCS